MKRKTMIAGAVVASLLLGGSILGGSLLRASDHGDAPAVAGKSTDLTDLYVFQSPVNEDNMVFVGNVQGLLSPTATASARFDENTLMEFKIDNDNDNVEDLVIQCVCKKEKMYIYGPVKPIQTGASSTIVGKASLIVDVTPYKASQPTIGNSPSGITAFAGPRDDPFFFDVAQYVRIVSGEATGFNNPGTDALAGTNVMSVVIEVPKSMLKSSGKINVWLQTKQKN